MIGWDFVNDSQWQGWQGFVNDIKKQKKMNMKLRMEKTQNIILI